MSPCGAPLFARYDLSGAARELRPGHLALRGPTLWRYREVLPDAQRADRASLGVERCLGPEQTHPRSRFRARRRRPYAFPAAPEVVNLA